MSEKFLLNDILIDYLEPRINKEKLLRYQELYDCMNVYSTIPFFINKFSLVDIDTELVNLLVDEDDEDYVIPSLDNLLKELIVENFKREGLEISLEIPLFVLCDMFSTLLSIVQSEKEMVEGVISLIYGRNDSNFSDYQDTFTNIILEFSSLSFSQLREHILSVDEDFLLKILSCLENTEIEVEDFSTQEDAILKKSNYFKFTKELTNLKAMQVINKEKLWNKDFDILLNYLSKFMTNDEKGFLSLFLAIIVSKDGERFDLDKLKEVLSENDIQGIFEAPLPVIELEIKKLFAKFKSGV